LYTKNNSEIITEINLTDVDFKFYGSYNIRILKSPSSKFLSKESLMVVKKL